MLEGKNVLLAISASIAAYKSAFLCRILIKKGANVKVLMTPQSADFITPLTLSTLSKNPVYKDYYKTDTGEWNNHVDLAKWADFMLLAPATENTLAKMAKGICDNLLLACYFSMENRVFFAPSMDLDMFKHPANQENIAKLQSFGNILIPAEYGELASGLVGEGRMADVENIVAFVEKQMEQKWKGVKVLLTAGPTYEAIDPVRFIGNHSSGKMGYALADELILRGAEVTLVSGPTSLSTNPKVKVHSVVSASEMFEKVESNYQDVDVVIMSAAVSDYTPVTAYDRKIKKKEDSLNIQLQPTKDILKFLGENKKKQKLIGFALETDNELANAKVKLERKNLDFIVLNSMQDKGAGFGGNTNKITILSKDNKQFEFELKTKAEVAIDILNTIEPYCV